MSALSDKLREIEQIVGAPNLLTATDAVARYRVEGQQPLAVAFPQTAEQVASVLHRASDAGLTVLLRGTGTHTYLGAPPGPIGLIVSLERLTDIIEFDHENLTITAQAGVTLAQLQQAAAQKGQMLPIDPPGGDAATIGAIAATNLAGPLRLRYGAPRDLIIGLRVALPDGTLVKTGGKTVKNVAGYELTKLFIGSYGTLGAICEVTVRLTPLPEAKGMVVAALAPDRAKEVVRELLRSRLEVASIAVSDLAALERMRLPLRVKVPAESLILFAGLISDRIGVDRQQREMREMVGADSTPAPAEHVDAIWRAIREVSYPTDSDELIVRAGVPLSAAHDILQMTASCDSWWSLARPGDGIVFAGCTAGNSDVEKLGELRRAAEGKRGYAIIESSPLEVKRGFTVWGEIQNADLCRRLKESYDPRGIMGCGRYLAGRE